MKRRDIPGYKGIYSVTKNGRVWSCRRKSLSRERVFRRMIGGHFLTPKPDDAGYLTVNLYDGINVLRGRTRRVHRLLAEAFIPNPKNLPTVNHKNGIKADNRLQNLEWFSYSENLLHAYNTGLKRRRIVISPKNPHYTKIQKFINNL